MNVSGPAVLSAWRTFVRDHEGVGVGGAVAEAAEAAEAGPALGLVILHDELESSPSTLKIRRGMAGSTKGHNGLKSVLTSLRSAGLSKEMESRLVRMGVGIGRPSAGGRERGEVSDYVLGKVTVPERERIEGLVGRLVDVLGEDGERIAKLR